jgi:hypothetical protein
VPSIQAPAEGQAPWYSANHFSIGFVIPRSAMGFGWQTRAGLEGGSARFASLGAYHCRIWSPNEGYGDPAWRASRRFRRSSAVLRMGIRKRRARHYDVSGMMPPSCARRAQRSRIAANVASIAALIFKNSCRPWLTILPAVANSRQRTV